MSIFVIGLAASLAAGALQETVGWQMLNLMLLPWLGLAALALIWRAIGAGRGGAERPALSR
jgi:hypothetical protein